MSIYFHICHGDTDVSPVYPLYATDRTSRKITKDNTNLFLHKTSTWE